MDNASAGAALEGLLRGLQIGMDWKNQATEKAAEGAYKKQYLDYLNANLAQGQQMSPLEGVELEKAKLGLEMLKNKMSGRGGGTISGIGGAPQKQGYNFFKQTKDGGWIENDFGKQALKDINTLGKNVGMFDLPNNVKEYISEKTKIHGSVVLPNSVLNVLKNLETSDAANVNKIVEAPMENIGGEPPVENADLATEFSEARKIMTSHAEELQWLKDRGVKDPESWFK
jgi:hypothetical protein